MGAALVAGCEDLFGGGAPPRDWDELIPRLMGAAKKDMTPEEAARAMFNVTSPDERRDAIAYLQTKPWGHEPPYIRAYELLSTDPHPMVRAQALLALGTSQQEAEAPYLIKGLKDNDVQVRRDAALGLTATWSEAASVPLAELVKKDTDEQVRILAARALAKTKTPDAYRALIDALNDRDAAVVKYAHDSLVASTGQDFSYNNKSWLQWYQQTYVMPASAPASGPAGGLVAPGGGDGGVVAPGTRP
jgi:HEAT repeat protein